VEVVGYPQAGEARPFREPGLLDQLLRGELLAGEEEAEGRHRRSRLSSSHGRTASVDRLTPNPVPNFAEQTALFHAAFDDFVSLVDYPERAGCLVGFKSDVWRTGDAAFASGAQGR
jgi:hypothetical protein